MKKLYLLLGIVTHKVRSSIKSLAVLLIFVFLLSISFVSAVVNDAIVSYSFNNVDTPLQDDSGNGITLTNNGATRFLQTGSNYAYDFDGTNDYMTFNPSISTGDKTYSLWIRSDGSATTTTENIFDNLDATNKGFQIRQNLNTVGDDLHVVVDDSYDIDSNIIPTVGTWYHILVTESSGTTTFYLNNVNVGSTPHVSTVTTVDFNLGRGNKYTTRLWNGAIDQVMIFDRALNTTERTELYNSGVIYNPYPPANITINDSTESTAVVKQVGSVSFSAGMTTILSSNFNVSVNETPLYGGYSFNVESNSGNTMYCELLIDGVVRSNITRTQTAKQLGSVFIQTPTFLIDEGEHSQLLQCQRSAGLGAITITNADGIGHFLINQDLDFLPYNTSSFTNEAVSSGSSYTLIDSFTITIGNKTEVDTSQNRTNHIVLENQISYTNLGGSTELLSAYMSVNGTNCSKYPRTVTSGSTGSVSMDCIIQNVTANATYTINVYANGSNAQYTGNTVAKNFFLSEGEIIGGTGVISGYSFSGANWNQIFNTSGGNLNHDVANAFTKLSYSVVTDINTQVDFYVVVADGNTFTTNTWSRDFVAGQTGVLIGHDILEDLPQDPNYNISLFARCGTGATCTIQGGSSLGYLTDVITTVLNGFNVSAYDYWDNSSINNFTVVDGGTWTTTTGSVFVFTENNPENLTISSNNYFDLNVNNHNTSNDYTAYLKQSDIKFQATQIITDNEVSPANFTIDGVTKGVNESFYLKAGTYNVTFSKTGYYDKTQEFTVAALDNETIIVTDVSDTIINITAKHFINNDSITSFNGWLYHAASGTNITFITTTGYSQVEALNDTTFLLHIESDGYATLEETITVNTTPVYAYTVYMYSFNSIYINIYDLFTSDLITQQVDIDVISSIYSTTVNTTNGTYYLTLLTPEDYTLRFSSLGYITSNYFITVNNDSSQNLNVYLFNTSNSYNVTVNIVDESAQNVEGAIVKASRYDVITNTYKLYAAGVTNSDGETILPLTFNDEYYKFTVEYNGVTKKVTSPQYITGTTLVIQIFIGDIAGNDYYNYLGIDSSLVFNTNTNNFRFTYNDLDGLGDNYCLYVYKLTGTGETLTNSSCSSSSSGTILLGVTPVNGTYYVARAYYDGTFLIDDSYQYPDNVNSGGLGLLMQLFLTLAFSMIAFADLGLLPIAVGVSLIFGKLAMLNAFGWGGIIAFMIIMIFVSIAIYGFRG